MAKNPTFNVKLERYLLGELPAKEMARMKAEIGKSLELQRKLEALEEENQSYYGKYPTLGGTAPQQSWFSTRFRAIAGGLAFAVAATCIVLFWPTKNSEQKVIALGNPDKGKIGEDPEIVSDGGIRSKGLKPDLFLYLKERALANGANVRAGDEIQIQYRASGSAYGAILSVDAAKSVTLHFPDSAAGSQKLKSGGKVPLPNAFKLDDTPGFEEFILVTAEKKLPLRKIIAELGRTGKVTAPKIAGFHAVRIRLQKE